jgi:hypothetical protein
MSDYLQVEPIGVQPTLGFSSDGRTFTLNDLKRGLITASQIVDRCAGRLKS